MASLLGRVPDYEFSTLLLNRPAPNMPPAVVDRTLLPTNIIEISDDEDDLRHNHRQNPTHPDIPAQNIPPQGSSPVLTSTVNTRIKPETSPVGRRDSKRQKLGDVPESSGSRSQHTRAHLEFAKSKEGYAVAYPTFFDNAPDYDPTFSDPDLYSAAPVLQEAATSQARRSPYYFDAKLNILMYCGPGHEQFPLPVDHDQNFQDACDAFDALEWDNMDGAGHKDTPITTVQQNCLAKILDVFPDVQREFVLDKIRSQHELIQFPEEEIEMHPDSTTIINEILEMDDYPKQIDSEEPHIEFEDRLGKPIVWNKDHCRKPNYMKDVVVLLASQFDHVPTHFINATVMNKGNLFDAYLHIENVESNYFKGSRPYNRSKRPRVQLEKKYQSLDPQLDQPYYCGLVVELQAGKQQFLREKLQNDQKQQIADAETANLEQHRLDGLLVQCGCCFDDEVPINRTVVCTGGEEHPFCYNCVKNLAESQIGLKRYQMQCMHESNCTHNLDNDGIGKAVPIKTFDRLQFNQQQAEIRAANIEGLEQCPLCDFQAICDPPEISSVFSCQNPDCFKVTCRLCHEISHLPKTCEEVKKDRGLSARHRIEEARTRAMIRTCPSCQSAIIKSDGCNKLRCTCGSIICYACKCDLSKLRDAYSHFDRGLANGVKCPLYDDKTIDRHVKETDEAEEKAIQEAKAEDNSIEESTLRIETGKGKAVDHQAQEKIALAGPVGGLNADLNQFIGQHMLHMQQNELFNQMINEAGRRGARRHRNENNPRNHRNMPWLDGLRARLPQGTVPIVPGMVPTQGGVQPAVLVPPIVPGLHNFNQNNQNTFGNPFGAVDRDYGHFQAPPVNFAYGGLQNQNQNHGFDYNTGLGPFGAAPEPMNPRIIDDAYMNTAQRIHQAHDQRERRRSQVERRNTVHNEVPPEVNGPNMLIVRNNNNDFAPQAAQAQDPRLNRGTQRVLNDLHGAHPAPAVNATMAGAVQNNVNADDGNDMFANFIRAQTAYYGPNQGPNVNFTQNQPQSPAANRAPQSLLENQNQTRSQTQNQNLTPVFGFHNRNQGVVQNQNQALNQPQPLTLGPQNHIRPQTQDRPQEWMFGQARGHALWPAHNLAQGQNQDNAGGPESGRLNGRQPMPLDNINNGNGNGFGQGFGGGNFRW